MQRTPESGLLFEHRDADRQLTNFRPAARPSRYEEYPYPRGAYLHPTKGHSSVGLPPRAACATKPPARLHNNLIDFSSPRSPARADTTPDATPGASPDTTTATARVTLREVRGQPQPAER